jgi:hypothetical protein
MALHVDCHVIIDWLNFCIWNDASTVPELLLILLNAPLEGAGKVDGTD